MKSSLNRMLHARWLQLITGSAISILAIYLALREISIEEMGDTLSRVNWGYVVFALIAVGTHHISKAIRWKLLFLPVLRERRMELSLRDLFLALMAGQMLNLVYPGRVGDVSRIWIIGNRGAGKAAAAGTVLLEKMVDTILYAIFIVGLIFLIPVPDWLSGILIVVVGMLVGFALLMILARKEQFWTEASRKLEHLWRSSRVPWDSIRGWLALFRNGFSGFSDLQGWQPLALLILWSVVAWGMSLLINWAVALSIGLEFETAVETLAAQLLVLVGLQAGITVPSLPGRVGVFEYICILALGVFGIKASESLSFGIVLHLVVMLPTMLAGWAAFMIFGLDQKRDWVESTADQNR